MNSLSEARPLTDLLFNARADVDASIDLDAYPISKYEALALQLDVAARYAEQGDPIAGWKVAYTSGGQRDRMGAGYRAFGFVPRSRVLDSGATVPLAGLRNPAIEVEICLRVDERGAATEAAAAFEVIDRRVVPGAGDATVVADGCANWGIVVGPFVPLPDVALVQLEARVSCDGGQVGGFRPGSTMDDPLLSLERLKERLAEYGRTLSAGQCVITGSITKSDVDRPGRWCGEVEGLGSVELTFA